MKLKIIEIISFAFKDIWENRRDFSSLAFIPVLMVSIVGTLVAALVGDPKVLLEDTRSVPTDLLTKLVLGTIINWIFGLIFYTLFAVTWFRRTLVGPENITIAGAISWKKRHWKFFSRLILIIVNLFGLFLILSFLFMMILPISPVLIILILLIGLTYGRLCLVLPAEAEDRKISFKDSIQLTNGNTLPLLIGAVALPFSVMLFGSVIILSIASGLTSGIGSSVTAQFLLLFTVQSINYIGFAISITTLAIIYRQLIN